MSEDSRISRKTLSIMILVVCIFIVLLYNLPGSRRPGVVESGPLVVPEAGDPLNSKTARLESIKLIEKAQKKSHQVKIESWETPKGARVLFVKAAEIPMLDVRLVFDAGAARDGDSPGLAKLTNAMLTEGAGISNVDEIARHFEGLGADLSTDSYRDMALVSLRTLSDPQYRDAALSLFYDVVAHPTFPSSSLQRLRSQMQLSLEHEKQSPGALAQNAFYKELYGNAAYSTPPNGTESSLSSINKGDLEDFHKRYYVASNMVVGIIGAIDRTEAELIAAQLDKQLPTGQRPTPIDNVKALTAPVKQHIEFPSSQTHILVGGVGIKRGDPDLYALSVGNEILGGGGFTSRLNQVIRQDNGLAYSIYSQFIPMAAQGPFLINLQTRSDQTKEALQLLDKTLREFVENGPSEEELADAKRNLLGSFPLQTASNSNVAQYLGLIGFYDLPLNYLEKYPSAIEAVSREDIQKAFSRMINTNAMLTVTAGQSDNASSEKGNASL